MKINAKAIKAEFTLTGDDALIHQICDQIIDNYRDDDHFSYYIAIARVFMAQGHYELNRDKVISIAAALRGDTDTINHTLYKKCLTNLSRNGYLYSKQGREWKSYGSRATRAYGLSLDILRGES